MNSCMIKEPANKLYLTRADFPEFQNMCSELIENEERKPNKCSACNGCGKRIKVQNITFVVTESCNLNCTYCYEKHKTKNKMSKEIAKDAIDFIFNEEKTKMYFSKDTTPGVIIEFIGGEPLIEIELMDYIVEYFKMKAFEIDHPWATNYMISFTSNGVLYLTDKVQRFLKKNLHKVSATITVDGNKQLHDACRVFPDGSGSYDIAAKAAKKLLEDNQNSTTKITLAPENIMYTFEAHKDLWNFGFRGAHSNCVFEEGWQLEHAKIFYSELKKLADYLLENKRYKRHYTSLFDDSIGSDVEEPHKNWCGGNGEMLSIGPDGRLYPCIRYMKYSLSTPGREEKSIGDIYNGINTDDPWLKELQKIDMISQSPEKCLKCKIASGCSLCTAYHYDKFGDANRRATYICETHQARVMANHYFFNKLYKQEQIDKHFNLNIPKEWALRIIEEDEYNMLLSL